MVPVRVRVQRSAWAFSPHLEKFLGPQTLWAVPLWSGEPITAKGTRIHLPGAGGLGGVPEIVGRELEGHLGLPSKDSRGISWFGW